MSEYRPESRGDNPKFESLNTGSVSYTGFTPDYRMKDLGSTVEDSNQTTTQTSFSSGIVACKGAFDPTDLPDDYTLYGRFAVSLGIDDSNETVYAQPRFAEPGVRNYDISELQVTAVSGYPSLGDSGWQDISGVSFSTTVFFDAVQCRVSNGSAQGTIDPNRVSVAFAGVKE